LLVCLASLVIAIRTALSVDGAANAANWRDTSSRPSVSDVVALLAASHAPAGFGFGLRSSLAAALLTPVGRPSGSAVTALTADVGGRLPAARLAATCCRARRRSSSECL
jgi:hypothetical protein